MQLADMLVLPAMGVLFLALAVLYALIGYMLVYPWVDGTIDLYSHFRLEASFANQTSAVHSISDFGVFDGECHFDQVNTTVHPRTLPFRFPPRSERCPCTAGGDGAFLLRLVVLPPSLPSSCSFAPGHCRC
jgi:hypothetical protein